jgi:tetratricopeptide (TPR) repeat protein
MGKDDWFRNTHWDEEIEAAFRLRLNRSRGPFHKAQYLRIQGWCLLSSADAACQKVGIALLNELVREYADQKETRGERFEALSELGDYYYEREMWIEAYAHYKKAISIDPRSTLAQQHTIIGYIKSAVLSKQNADYPDCLERLQKLEDPIFPYQSYDLGLSGALLFHAMGLTEAAETYASIALKSLGLTSPIIKGGKPFGEASASNWELLFLYSIINPPCPS